MARKSRSRHEWLGELVENFFLLRVGDPPLSWDVPHIRLAYDTCYLHASRLGWKIRTRCEPPRKNVYEVVAGRLKIERLS
jgi:hypothetical protein